MILIPSSQRHFFDWSLHFAKNDDSKKRTDEDDICIQTDGRAERCRHGLNGQDVNLIRNSHRDEP